MRICFSRAIAATALLLVLAAASLAPRDAGGQTLSELGATNAARNEMISGGANAPPAPQQPNQEELGGAPAAAAPAAPTQVDQTAVFLQQSQTLTLNILLAAKLLLWVGVVWMWVAAGDWVNKDSQIYGLGYQKWSLVHYLPFFIVSYILFFVPLATWIKALILFIVFFATWLPYVLVHNKNVEPHLSVLTGPWWRFAFATVMGSIGIKVSSERRAGYEQGAPVELMAMGAADTTANNANLITARHSPGYLLLKDIMAEVINRRADKLMLDFTAQAVTVRYEIDGVWHPGEARDRESSDVMLAVIKTLANLNVKDRRNKQEGRFGAKYDGKTYICHVATQGVQTGERVVVNRVGEKQRLAKYEDLGMREGLQKQWSEIMGSDAGMVIFSALPGGGLTTMMNVSLEETDRLMRDFSAIEEVNNREHDLQNIGVTTYDASKGETPASILPALIRTYPNVYILRDMTDVEAGKLLFKEAGDDRVFITSIRAKEAAEALLRFLQLKMPAKEFATTAKAVLYQRLIRKLCPDCKVGYSPSADVLKKLGIPPGKVEKLYRPPKPEEIEKPCKTCQNLGYLGRTGLFELLVVNDQMREILIKQPKLELLKQAARAARQRSLQEEGVLLVAQGTTSLQELTRVLQQ
ncbi:MAG: ATPase, T2SS/T4P/T4SS family [Bythopirellula sp.]|nr:ATPase, T2SS/T4P/T4SS family [Bythopirellula sp.]